MKKAQKLFAVLFGVVMLVSCMTTSALAAETGTQDGLKAVIQTDKENYAANEDIQITVTVTNTNTFEVKNVSIESLLPDALTLKDGDLKSKTVDLKPGETLSISCVAVLEKEEPTTTVPTTTEPVTEPPATTEPGTTHPEETTTKETTTEATTETTTETTTVEPTTAPDTTETDTETPSTTEQTETTTDSGAILPVEPSTTEPTTGIIEGELTTVNDTPDNPDTGSGSTIVKALLIALAAAAVVAAIVLITRKNNKKATKVISLVLCGAIAVSSFATVGFIKVGAEENERPIATFPVNKSITVDGEAQELQGIITYEPHKFSFQFKINPFDILVGEKTTVKFSATYVGNDTNNFEPAVYDNNGNQIIVLNDNGKNGDEIANDNVYSADLELYSDEEKFVNYHIKENGQIDSNTVEVQFYKPFTEQELDEVENFNEELGRITQRYTDSEGYIPEKVVAEYLSEICEFCDKQEDIIDYYLYDKENRSIYIELKSGMSYTVIPPIKGKLVGGVESEILTLEPSGAELQKWYGQLTNPSRYQDVVETANNIANCIPSITYPDKNKLKDEEVSIEQLKNLSPFKVLLWMGHGGYSKELGPTLSTSTKYEKRDDNKYDADIKAKRITIGYQSIGPISYNYHYSITSKFIDAYFPFTTGDSIAYFGACHSCEDERLAESLFNKGVDVVFGYNDLADAVMEPQIRRNLFSTLCSLPIYPTAQEAYDADKSYINYNFTMYAVNANIRLSYNAPDPLPGEDISVSGTVIDAETGSPLEATVEVSRLGETIERKTNPQDGSFNFELEPGEYTIRITSPGYQFIYTTFNVPSGTDYQFLGEFNLTRLPEQKPSIGGYVKDRQTDKYLPGVTVTVYDETGTTVVGSSITDRNGSYTVVLEKLGTYDLVFHKDGYEEYVMDNYQATYDGLNGTSPVYLTPANVSYNEINMYSPYDDEQFTAYLLEGRVLTISGWVDEYRHPAYGLISEDVDDYCLANVNTETLKFGIANNDTSAFIDLAGEMDGIYLFYFACGVPVGEGFSITNYSTLPIVIEIKNGIASFVTTESYKINKDVMEELEDSNPSKYLELDEQLVNSAQLAEIRQLALQVTAGKSTDTDKAEAIYEWICNNISYDASLMDGTLFEQSPTEVLKRRTAVCDGYAQLTQAMLVSLNIPCTFVSGYAPSTGYLPDDSDVLNDPTSHAWNIAYLDGRWVLIDSTWGATSAVGTAGWFDTDLRAFSINHRFAQFGHEGE